VAGTTAWCTQRSVHCCARLPVTTRHTLARYHLGHAYHSPCNSGHNMQHMPYSAHTDQPYNSGHNCDNMRHWHTPSTRCAQNPHFAQNPIPLQTYLRPGVQAHNGQVVKSKFSDPKVLPSSDTGCWAYTCLALFHTRGAQALHKRWMAGGAHGYRCRVM
jgi:hypothetical protein